MAQLLGNQPTADFLANSGTHAPATRGLRFQVTETTEVGFLGWYRPTTGFSAFGRLLLYNAAGVLIRSADTVTDSGAVGWQWSPITTTTLTAGVTYTVAASTFTSGLTRIYPYCPRASRVAPPAPFIHDDVGTFANTSGPNLYPTTADNTIVVALSVQTGTGIDPGAGEGDPALTGDLGAWLSSDPDVQTHEADGLPWLTKVATDVIATGVTTLGIITPHIEDIVENIPQRSDSEWVKLTKLINLWLELSDLEYELLMDFLRRGPQQLTGPTPGGGSAFYGPTGRQVAETAERIEDAVGNLRAPLEGFPTEFELVDSIDFVDCVAWPVAADVYVLHITAAPHGRAFSDMCGVSMCRRAGWWAPLADSIPGQRGYIDFEFNVISAPVGRLPGVLIELDQDGAGTLEAWRRVTP